MQNCLKFYSIELDFMPIPEPPAVFCPVLSVLICLSPSALSQPHLQQELKMLTFDQR